MNIHVWGLWDITGIYFDYVWAAGQFLSFGSNI